MMHEHVNNKKHVKQASFRLIYHIKNVTKNCFIIVIIIDCNHSNDLSLELGVDEYGVRKLDESNKYMNQTTFVLSYYHCFSIWNWFWYTDDHNYEII